MLIWRDDNPRFKARVAGALYLLALFTVFPGQLLAINAIATGDAATTLEYIRANDQNLRLAFAATLVSLATSMAASIVLYGILMPVSWTLAAQSVGFAFLSFAISACAELLRLLPLFYGDADAAMSALHMAGLGGTLALMFYGCSLTIIGLLAFRSRFFPRWLGELVFTAGGSYLGHGLMRFVSPDLLAGLPSYLRQSSFGIGDPIMIIWMLWLLIVGVHASRWREVSSSRARHPA